MASIAWDTAASGGGFLLESPRPTPANRFFDWEPDFAPVGPRAHALGDGKPYLFNFRDDYTFRLTIRHLHPSQLEDAMALKLWLMEGGPVDVNTDDNEENEYEGLTLRPETTPEIKNEDDIRQHFSFSVVLRGFSALVVNYGPPETSDGEPPEDPDIPTENPTLLADWDPTEGSGSTLADKFGDFDAFLGLTSQNPGWVADPTRATGPYGSAGFLMLKYMHCSSLPFDALETLNIRRHSIFAYVKPTESVAGDGQWIFRLTAAASSMNSTVRLFNSGQVRYGRNQGNGSEIAVQSTTTLAEDSEYTIAIVTGREIGEPVEVYVNGVLEDASVLDFPVAAFSNQPRLVWGADEVGFSGGIGFPGIIGRTLFYDGMLDADQIAGIHEAFKVIYPGLP